jgi:hypothetical protein
VTYSGARQKSKAVGEPLILGRDVSDKLKAARSAFEAARAVVTIVGVIAFLAFALIGYIATGGDGIGSFLDYVLGGFH